MCGICGKISYGSKPIEEKLIKKMCGSFSYRGPDDSGTYTNNAAGRNDLHVHVGMGHQRLAIIDLSSAGHQPMSNEDQSIWVTFNGEIYNFRQIRADLQKKGHIFKSETDSEVLIHLYEEHGLDAVHALNGMFAFALWDQNLNRLWMCRDRIGIKPLVYYWNGEHFVFASEIKALLNDPIISKQLDANALLLYLAFNFIPAPHTIYKGIQKLEPGQYLILQDKNLRLKNYWDTSQTVDPDLCSLSYAELENRYKKHLFERLENAVCARMMADVPLGAFLSGGIDSSIIVALMARNSPKPAKTFSIGFKGDNIYDETHYARQVAAHYHTDHHEFRLNYRDLLDVFNSVLATFDEPFADSSAIPTYIVSRETKQWVNVALSGDGGDELFGGYRCYLGEYWYSKYMLIPGLLRKNVFEKLVSVLPDARDKGLLEYIRRLKKFVKSTKGSFPERLLALKEVFPQELRKRILSNGSLNQNTARKDPALKRVQNLLNGYQGDRINSMLYSDFKDSLPGDMLTKVDWMSMKNSLEVRVPFLDHRVVELAFRIHGSFKLYRGKTKYILKETFKQLLPQALYRRPKAGFEVPISRWLKTDLKFFLDQYLCEKKIRRQGIFDNAIIQELVHHHITDKTDTSWMLWNLIVFQYWYDHYFI